MSPSRTQRASVSDVVEVVKAYALQEIVDPLKGLGRWIGAGIGGADLLGLGLLLLLMGVLRLIQTSRRGRLRLQVDRSCPT